MLQTHQLGEGGEFVLAVLWAPGRRSGSRVHVPRRWYVGVGVPLHQRVFAVAYSLINIQCQFCEHYGPIVGTVLWPGPELC